MACPLTYCLKKLFKMKIFSLYEQATTVFMIMFGMMIVTNQFFPQLNSLQKKAPIKNVKTVRIIQTSSLNEMNNYDTIPILHSGKTVFRSVQDDMEYFLKIDDDQIENFEINGQSIPAEDYDRFRNVIMALQRNIHPVPNPFKTSGVPNPPIPPKPGRTSGTSFEEAITNKLWEDGLIDNRQLYSFEISKDVLRINGERMAARILSDYIKFVEDNRNIKMNEGTTYMIEKND